jgi:hypothetical protein
MEYPYVQGRYRKAIKCENRKGNQAKTPNAPNRKKKMENVKASQSVIRHVM